MLYNTVCVMLRLTLKMALRRHEFEYETVDVKLTPRLDEVSGDCQPMRCLVTIRKRYPFLHKVTASQLRSHGACLGSVQFALR